jgi:L-ascorbate metabolism protein UlaG (beta-lactamase superfamily)
MELQFYGANCLKINTKNVSVVIDDNLKELGGKSVAKKGDVVIATNTEVKKFPDGLKLVINTPGEYEVSGVSVQGITARAHMDTEEEKTAVIYKIVVGDVRLVVAGHIFPELSDEQLEAIGTIDVLVVPVGGNGYTLDGIGALKLIKDLDPKLVIPTHYADKSLNYPVPQRELADSLKEMSFEPASTVPKLKVKLADLSDLVQLIVLEKQ